MKVLVSRFWLFVTPTGSSDHGILQARLLEIISFSRGSSPPRNQTWVSTKPGFCVQADSSPLSPRKPLGSFHGVFGPLVLDPPSSLSVPGPGAVECSTQWDTVEHTRWSRGTAWDLLRVNGSPPLPEALSPARMLGGAHVDQVGLRGAGS